MEVLPMLRKTLLFVVAALFVAALCYAEDKPSAMANTATQISGTIEHLDVQAKTITLKTKKAGKEETAIYTYNTQTRFTTGSKSVLPEDIQAGSQVTVKADTNRVITSLEVREPTDKTRETER